MNNSISKSNEARYGVNGANTVYSICCESCENLDLQVELTTAEIVDGNKVLPDSHINVVSTNSSNGTILYHSVYGVIRSRLTSVSNASPINTYISKYTGELHDIPNNLELKCRSEELNKSYVQFDANKLELIKNINGDCIVLYKGNVIYANSDNFEVLYTPIDGDDLFVLYKHTVVFRIMYHGSDMYNM